MLNLSSAQHERFLPIAFFLSTAVFLAFSDEILLNINNIGNVITFHPSHLFQTHLRMRLEVCGRKNRERRGHDSSLPDLNFQFFPKINVKVLVRMQIQIRTWPSRHCSCDDWGNRQTVSSCKTQAAAQLQNNNFSTWKAKLLLMAFDWAFQWQVGGEACNYRFWLKSERQMN